MDPGVVFVDVMGVGAAIDAVGSDKVGEVLSEATLRWELHPAGGYETPAGRVRRIYRGFEAALHELIEMQGTIGYPTFSDMVIFSDCAYIATGESDVRKATAIAADLMLRCFRKHVPVRIGVAHGSYLRRPFSMVNHPDGPFVTEAPFLGTGVLGAYRAQASSCPGFRILLHPSALSSIRTYGTIPLAPEERSESAIAEVNYVVEGLRPNGDRQTLESFLDALAAMRRHVKVDRAVRHYDATERAIRRLYTLDWNNREYMNWLHERLTEDDASPENYGE